MRSAALFLVLAACAGPRAESTRPEAPALPFIEDDFARAMTLAHETGKPVFVDAWAPW